MPKFESGGQQKSRENVWGHEGDFAQAALDTDLSDFKLASVPDTTDVPGLRDIATRADERKAIAADPDVISKLLGGADLTISQNDERYNVDRSENDPTQPTPGQLETAEAIYDTPDRITNLARVDSSRGTPGEPTKYGEVPGDIRATEARYMQAQRSDVQAHAQPLAKAPLPTASEHFGTPQPSWTNASPLTERPPLTKKPFYKRWLGL